MLAIMPVATRVARRRVELVVTEQGLDDADVGTALQKVGREAVAKRMHRHRLADARRLGRGVEQATELAGGDRPARPAVGNSQRCSGGTPVS